MNSTTPIIRNMVPVSDFPTFRDTMDRLFSESFSPAPVQMTRAAGPARPAADAWEDDDQVVILLALPGVSAENVDITFERDRLMIEGKSEARDEARSWVLAERSHGDFKREFRLKTPIDVENVSAHFDGGVLTLTLPKREESKPRKIEINAG
jgi:HSP20 family protein